MKFADLQIVPRLTFAHLRHRSMRMLLTVFATIAAACVVVWVVSGYDSLIKKFDEFADVYLGRYEFVVVPYTPGQEGSGTVALNNRTNDPPLRFNAKLVDELRADPAVAIVDPILQTPARIAKPGAPAEERRGGERGSERGGTASGAGTRGTGGRRRGSPPPMLVGTDAAESPYTVLEGRWIDPQKPDANEAVISNGYAQQLKVKLADELQVKSANGQVSLQLRIVGIVEQRKTLPPPPPLPGTHPSRGAPLPRGPAVEAVYVPLAMAESVADLSGLYDLLGVVLKPDYNADEFQANWRDRLASESPMAQLQSLQGVEAELNDSVGSETVRGQAYMATGVSLLAALFIIFSTLSMGVDERVRQFAMLRAVACSKAQIAAIILFESLLLGLVGWGGGLLAGWGLLIMLTSLRADLFPDRATIGFWCIALSGACAVGGALAAAILPAWKATRVKPLEAMAQTRVSTTRIPRTATVLGLLLVSLNPLLVFYVPMPDAARYLAFAAVGCVSMGIGFILLAPAVILITERLFAPIVCRLFATDPRLFATQLSTNLWRTLGTTVALTLGLGLFIAMQTWGYSMLAPFVPGDWVPDMVVMMTPMGIPMSEVDAVRNIQGVDGGRSLPCIAEQTKFATDVTGANIRATTSRQDNCIMVGVDPDLGVGGAKPVFDFRYVRGTREEALSKLKSGRFCLVPDAFERESGLTVGDKFGVIPPNHPDQVVEYEIAGVVSMIGWHWMSKVGLRNRDGGRAAAMMIAALDQISKDMDVNRINSFWINRDGTATEDEIKKSLEVIVERSHDPVLARQQGPGKGTNADSYGTGAGAVTRGIEAPREGYSTAVNFRSREGTRNAIRERATGVIWLISRLPLITLLVTSLGVVNTIVSSIRARQWDMGVLRAVGVTRAGLIRMILCEATLLGISACILSLGFGVVAGYCGTGISRYINMRGGQITPLVVPWPQVGIGFAMTLGLCLMAALWPAIRTGRAEPLRLLQAGRAAM